MFFGSVYHTKPEPRAYATPLYCPIWWLHLSPNFFTNAAFFKSRHQSHIIPVRVGPHAETFYVHRDVLTSAEYFKKALDGDFKEAEDQAVDLPEEDAGIFSFVVAFLYEKTFIPIKPVADILSKWIHDSCISRRFN